MQRRPLERPSAGSQAHPGTIPTPALPHDVRTMRQATSGRIGVASLVTMCALLVGAVCGTLVADAVHDRTDAKDQATRTVVTTRPGPCVGEGGLSTTATRTDRDHALACLQGNVVRDIVEADPAVKSATVRVERLDSGRLTGPPTTTTIDITFTPAADADPAAPPQQLTGLVAEAVGTSPEHVTFRAG